MYDIKPLEEDWKRYKSKKRKPWYMFLSLFGVLLFGLFYILNESQHKTNIFDELQKKIHHFSKKSIDKHSKSMSHTILVNGSLNTLEFVNNQDIEENINKNTSSDELLVDLPILNVSSTANNNETTNKSKVYIDILETTSITAYEDVENRFKQTGDIDDALFLAKSYYKKGNFKKSEYWAFETNKLDSSLEESFLIFVKSKAKLGKLNEAISILNSYVKRTDSLEATALLEQLKNNRL